MAKKTGMRQNKTTTLEKWLETNALTGYAVRIPPCGSPESDTIAFIAAYHISEGDPHTLKVCRDALKSREGSRKSRK
jgi:hypothetical protein